MLSYLIYSHSQTLVTMHTPNNIQIHHWVYFYITKLHLVNKIVTSSNNNSCITNLQKIKPLTEKYFTQLIIKLYLFLFQPIFTIKTNNCLLYY